MHGIIALMLPGLFVPCLEAYIWSPPWSACNLRHSRAASGGRSFGGRLDMALTQDATARDVVEHFGPDLRGRTAIITGGNTGLGEHFPLLYE